MTKFSIFGKWLLGSANLATNTNPECHNFFLQHFSVLSNWKRKQISYWSKFSKFWVIKSNHNKYYVIFREIRDPHLLLDVLNPINQCNVKTGLTKP